MPVLGNVNPVEAADVVAASGVAVTIADPAAGKSMTAVVLTANCTVTLPTPAVGKSMTVALTQDATGSRAVTWAGGTVRWPNGTPPVISTAAGKTDLIGFVCVDNTTWLGLLSGKGH